MDTVPVLQVLRRPLWVIFAVSVLITIIVPFVLSVFRPGTVKLGFPYRFYRHTTAPPPFDETYFSWMFLAADLLICLAVAVVLAVIWVTARRGWR
jgi:hypothetical protein